MVVGMLISLVGFVATGSTMIGWFTCLAILVFSIGEMTCSPTFSAYVGLIAPKDKKALYMGYSNIPFAIGWAAGNGIGGRMYQAMSSKFDLARRYMVERLGMARELVEGMENEEVLPALAATLHDGAGGTVKEATQLLWDAYHPYMVWYYLGAFGLAGTIGMIIFYFATRRKRVTAGGEAT
jgi:predicted MFS family arabinose efflux permease